MLTRGRGREYDNDDRWLCSTFLRDKSHIKRSIRVVAVVIVIIVYDADEISEMAIVFVPKDQTPRRRRHDGVFHTGCGRQVEW